MPTSYDSEKMSIVMSGHETCKYGKKIERKNSWARECIFSSHRPQKSMKNKRINIKEEKFRILLENWSRYRSEEISPIGKWHRHITQICFKDKLFGFEYPTKSGGRGSKHPTGHAWIIFLPWRRCFVGMLFLLTNSFWGGWQIHITQSQDGWQHHQLLA